MGHASAMLETHPDGLAGVDQGLVTRCVEACLDCAQACTACADACLADDMVADLVRCVALNLNCADICDTTGRMMSRPTGFDAAVALRTVQACATVCATCAFECERHASRHEHCRVCAEACRRCQRACEELLAALA
ncbi:four-helix bundle copper-binding protein [Phytohabitans sp. ZYX-F-186]|uniref:Four-helix bundle copper-binding protein n=1 Tax=Phytohabitans maris TaxID=3071409 RepID=A0ABU0ZVG8_9ACTN|nr:four-helix bundle copper-binding protein [Phytohabitans sp. ZYX-F-186]MDQ7911039.1 four-helix bundle copper-binding protein [Phytohabitans sp. ZYX-F-186]